jgi:hypothetical protein
MPHQREEGASSPGLDPTAGSGPKEEVAVGRKRTPPACATPTSPASTSPPDPV